jgi:hypothetical protein
VFDVCVCVCVCVCMCVRGCGIGWKAPCFAFFFFFFFFFCFLTRVDLYVLLSHDELLRSLSPFHCALVGLAIASQVKTEKLEKALDTIHHLPTFSMQFD